MYLMLPYVISALTVEDNSALYGILAFVAASFVEHAIYSWVWLDPKSFRAIVCGGNKVDPIDRLHLLLSACKALQLVGAISGLWHHMTLNSPSVTTAIAFLACLFGQVLNMSVYKAIGKAGVYYGIKFGRKIPWCTGFPYNSPAIPGWGPILAHPQYMGATLTYFGMYGLFLQTLPLGYFIIFFSGVSASYIAMSCIEGYL